MRLRVLQEHGCSPVKRQSFAKPCEHEHLQVPAGARHSLGFLAQIQLCSAALHFLDGSYPRTRLSQMHGCGPALRHLSGPRVAQMHACAVALHLEVGS